LPSLQQKHTAIISGKESFTVIYSVVQGWYNTLYKASTTLCTKLVQQAKLGLVSLLIQSHLEFQGRFSRILSVSGIKRLLLPEIL